MNELVYDFESPGTPIDDSQKIPSELIIGHLKRFLMIQVEALAMGLHTTAQVRSYLKGVEYFVGCSCGIHANLATSNEYHRFCSLSDDKMIEISKETFK
jgi:hypothetical protein